MARTKDDIVSNLISYINTVRPDMSIRIGTVTRDVVIDAPATEMETVYSELERTQHLQSVDYAEEQTTAELDRIASNFSLTRFSGTRASGSVTFRLYSFSITDPDVIIPQGTQVSTDATTTSVAITFETTQTAVMTAALAPTYFNATTGFFEITVPVQSFAIGSNQIVGANTIVKQLTTIAGIVQITNYLPTSGGTDQESNLDFADRIRVKASGNNLGTVSGIKSLIADPQVLDSLVVLPGDPELTRNEYGSSVDVYIVGDNLQQIAEDQTVVASTEFAMQQPPVRTVVSVKDVLGGVTYVEGTDYIVVKDPGNNYRGSKLATDKVVFYPSSLPTAGTVLTFTYTTNQLIRDLQDRIDLDTNHIVASDILIREADKVEVAVSASIATFSGFASQDVIDAVATAVGLFMNNMKLYAALHQSDLVRTIEGVDGVNYVVISTLVPTSDVIITRRQYVRPSTLTFSVV